MKTTLLKSAAVGLGVALVLASCSSNDSDSNSGAEGNSDLIERTKSGEYVDHGGAARLNGEDQTDAVRRAAEAVGAKNIILLIGDGMGDSEITIARNYEHGAGGFFPGLDALPLTGSYTTYSLDQETKLPNYVPDSAATGSGWATGTKTYNNAISVDINGESQKTLLELARAKGLKTGNVSTAEIQDATPAVQASHSRSRSCYGPEEMVSEDDCAEDLTDGRKSISEQILDTRADVTLGGGLESFQQVATEGDYANKSLLDQAKERGYNIVQDADALAGVSEANQDAPVLGLFSDGNMPVRWLGPKATRTGADEPAVECTINEERTADIPNLATLTQKAIDLLDNDKGFFLQVEGASIDKQNHNANPCGQIGETVDLDEATKVALDFATQNGDTLVIVTADHAHTSQAVYTETVTTGLTRNLRTKEGAIMTVAYGTSEAEESQMHTGSQVRIAAYGPGAANVVGLTDQTDTFFTISSALDLDHDAEITPGK